MIIKLKLDLVGEMFVIYDEDGKDEKGRGRTIKEVFENSALKIEHDFIATGMMLLAEKEDKKEIEFKGGTAI